MRENQRRCRARRRDYILQLENQINESKTEKEVSSVEVASKVVELKRENELLRGLAFAAGWSADSLERFLLVANEKEIQVEPYSDIPKSKDYVLDGFLGEWQNSFALSDINSFPQVCEEQVSTALCAPCCAAREGC